MHNEEKDFCRNSWTIKKNNGLRPMRRLMTEEGSISVEHFRALMRSYLDILLFFP
jgi:hypothetical protein